MVPAKGAATLATLATLRLGGFWLIRWNGGYCDHDNVDRMTIDGKLLRSWLSGLKRRIPDGADAGRGGWDAPEILSVWCRFRCVCCIGSCYLAHVADIWWNRTWILCSISWRETSDGRHSDWSVPQSTHRRNHRRSRSCCPASCWIESSWFIRASWRSSSNESPPPDPPTSSPPGLRNSNYCVAVDWNSAKVAIENGVFD